MAEGWLDGRWTRYNRISRFVPYFYKGHPNKFGAHTTEGLSFSGSMKTLDSKLAWPHLIARRDTNEYGQFLPFTVGARSFVSGSSFSSNKAEPGCIQIEICGFASDVRDDDFYLWIAEIVREVNAEGTCEIPMQVAQFSNGERVQFRDSAGYGGTTVYPDGTRHRFTPDEWMTAGGFVTHQTAPVPNLHWDPGKWDADKLEVALEEADMAMVTPHAESWGYLLAKGYITVIPVTVSEDRNWCAIVTYRQDIALRALPSAGLDIGTASGLFAAKTHPHVIPDIPA